MLISAYIRFSRRFSSAIAFNSEIIEASITRQVMLASPRGHPAKLRPPLIKTGIAHPVFAAKFRNRHSALGLLQYPHDLRVAVSFILHQNLPRYHPEKILRVNTNNFRRDYPITTVRLPRCFIRTQRLISSHMKQISSQAPAQVAKRVLLPIRT
jgi:hypothetical protein